MAERERRVAVVVGAIHQACTKTHTWTQEELHKPSSPSLVPSLTPPSLPLIHTPLSPQRCVAIHYRGSASEGLGAAV